MAPATAARSTALQPAPTCTRLTSLGTPEPRLGAGQKPLFADTPTSCRGILSREGPPPPQRDWLLGSVLARLLASESTDAGRCRSASRELQSVCKTREQAQWTDSSPRSGRQLPAPRLSESGVARAPTFERSASVRPGALRWQSSHSRLGQDCPDPCARVQTSSGQ